MIRLLCHSVRPHAERLLAMNSRRCILQGGTSFCGVLLHGMRGHAAGVVVLLGCATGQDYLPVPFGTGLRRLAKHRSTVCMLWIRDRKCWNATFFDIGVAIPPSSMVAYIHFRNIMSQKPSFTCRAQPTCRLRAGSSFHSNRIPPLFNRTLSQTHRVHCI